MFDKVPIFWFVNCVVFLCIVMFNFAPKIRNEEKKSQVLYRVSHQLCPNFKFDFGPFPLILQRTCIKYQSWSWTLRNFSHWETGDSLRFNDPRAFWKKFLKTGLLILTKSACHPHHHSPPPPPEQKLEGGPSKISFFDLFPWFYSEGCK